ncbi:hypothetical protein ACF0H5_006824 [Mactra antiquata]
MLSNIFNMAVLTHGYDIVRIFVCCLYLSCVLGAVFEPPPLSRNNEAFLTLDSENETSEIKDENNKALLGDFETKPISTSNEATKSNIDITKPGISMAKAAQTEYRLPEKWVQFCDITTGEYYESMFTNKTELITIRCHVTDDHSDIWTMLDLREYVQQFNNNSVQFSVELNCDHGAYVSLSFPFKVENLFKLFVKGCLIKDLFAEYNNHGTMAPDNLRVIELRDSTCVISIDTLINMTLNIDKIDKDFDCFHEETIEELTFRNISFDFLQSHDQVIMKLTEVGEQFLRKSKQIPHKCVFKHLMKLDEGQSSSRSVYHMDLVGDSGIYNELRTFNMSNNRLKVLNDAQLHWSFRFPKLETFDLSHNDITKLGRFEVPIHTSLDRVTTINLQHNQISTIHIEDLERFRLMPMVFIDLRNNGLNCNCSDDMTALIQYVSTDKHLSISNLSDYSYIEDLECSSPDELFGKSLKSLTPEMICGPAVHKEYFLVPILCLSAFVIVLAILLFIALRYRQEITVILFTRFNIIIPCQTREKYDNNKEFDAFVSYSSNEEEEVEKIFEDLENRVDGMSRPDLKFCMHHRDFVAGKTIFDNVTRAVENSRHTIILLSNHFLSSEFCLYEFQEAFRQSIMEKRRHLVIVMMESIPEDKLPRDLKRCLKTFTYIRRDDYLFTERLVYALSVKQKNKVVKSPKTVSNLSSSSDSDRQESTSPSKDTSISNCSKHKTSKNLSVSVKCSKKSSCSENDDIDISTSTDIHDFDNISVLHENDQSRMYKKLSKSGNGKLDLNIKQISDVNLSPVERKILQKVAEYDRSMSQISQDTGYGSDLASLGDRPSPEVNEHFDDYLHPVTC